MQFFLHDQHDAAVKIKYRKEFISRYAKFVYYNYNLECKTLLVANCNFRNIHLPNTWKAEWRPIRPLVCQSLLTRPNFKLKSTGNEVLVQCVILAYLRASTAYSSFAENVIRLTNNHVFRGKGNLPRMDWNWRWSCETESVLDPTRY